MSTLYLVATPIGNLEDMTVRGVRILRSVKLIAAEDTRHTARLLNHYDIRTPSISYHEHNKLVRLDRILAALAEGDVALVSDAGTPALNDPGYELARAAIQAGHAVSPIPGPSAPLAALVASGLPTDSFLYLGYLPRKSAARRSELARVGTLPYTLIFLETPHRLLESLADLREILGDRQLAVARELTKTHEEIFRGLIGDACDWYTRQPPRGEITLVVAGANPLEARWPDERLRMALSQALAQGQPLSQAVVSLVEPSGWKKKEIYTLAMQLSPDP